VTDAAAHEADDKQRREVIDARNQADALAYQAERTVNESREKLPVGELSKVEAAIAAAKTAAQGDDLAAIRKATDDLQRATHAVAELLGRATPGAGDSGSNVKEGEVVDAEYAETR
jgi:molecular chaperone DnaK